MNIVKNLLLTLIAMVVGLLLLSPQEPGWRDSTGMLPSLAPAKTATDTGVGRAPRDGVPALRLESETSRPVEINATAAAADTVQPLDWVRLLYPELTQILATESFPPDMALTELQPMLSDADPVVRLAALQSITEMNHPALLPTLNAALDDPEPQVRILALKALGTLDTPSAISSIEPYLFDRETEVRLAAIDALANLEYEQTVWALAALLSDQDTGVRRQAVNALGEIGGEQAIAYLIQARVDPDANIRANAIAILGELGNAPGY